jgi:uncharacterized membrane protein
MSSESRNSSVSSGADLEEQMRKVSLLVSVVAVVLMAGGFVGAALSGNALAVPGKSVLPIASLLNFTQEPLALAAMSTGILLLALLPLVRVFLATTLYVRQRVPLDAAAALVVMVELLVSMWSGG